MKKIIIAIVLFSALSAAIMAQGIVSSKTYISYRGMADVSFDFGDNISGYSIKLIPLGFQFNPYFFAGIGVGFSPFPISYTSDEIKRIVGVFEPSLLGNERRNIITTYEEYYAECTESGISIFAVVRLNLTIDKPLIPYIQINYGLDGGGIMSKELSFVVDGRIGLSKYFSNNKSSLSAFLGISLENVTEVWFRGNKGGTYEFRNSPYGSWEKQQWAVNSFNYDIISFLKFSIGLSYEFGGAAGFKKRLKKFED